MISSGVRKHLHSPWFALTVCVLVAAVVAINASAFSAIHALRWKALPYADGDQLVELQAKLVKFGFDTGLTETLRQRVLADSAHFSGALGFASARGGGEDGRTWQLTRVSPEFSKLLGVEPALGRAFLSEDAQAGNGKVLMLSHSLWRSRFGADPSVIGQDVRFNDGVYRIVGVMPPAFAFPDRSVEAWCPLVLSAAEQKMDEGGNVGTLNVIARLQAGVSVQQAEAALGTMIANEPSLAGLRSNAGIEAGVRPWRERFVSGQLGALNWFQIAAVILLLAVLANLVNLQLDRLLARRRELEIRRALGASDRAILTTVLADLAPPVVLGMLAGLALVPAILTLLVSRGLLPGDLPQGVHFGAAGLLFALAVGGLMLASGWIASLASSRPSTLNSRAGVSGMGRLRPALLVAQVMVTTALLGSAGLLLRSVVNLVNADRGFDSRGVIVSMVDPVGVTQSGVAFDPAQDTQRFAPVVETIRSAVASLPGIDQVAVANAPPFSGWEMVSTVRVPGQPENVQVRTRSVGPGYFSALGIGLNAGREFEAADKKESSGVIVDEMFRQRFLKGAEPLNAFVELGTATEGEFQRVPIVGVARTVKHETLDENSPLPTVYQLETAPLPVFWLVSHARSDAMAMEESVRRAILAVAPDATLSINEPLDARIEASLGSRHTLLEAVGGFALAALMLAAIGLVAVLGFAVRRRNAELAMRMTLGADRAAIQTLILRQGGGVVLAGLLLGLVAGLLIARQLRENLFELSFGDPLTWALVVAITGAVALLACWLPARRAASTDPMIALRSE